MSLKTIAAQFVELCNQGKNFDVMQGANTIHSEKVRGPYFNGGDQFAVHFTFDVTPTATGERLTLEEVGLYTVENDKITREQFYADGDR